MSQNAINWFEIPVSDLARASSFYEDLLQVTLMQESMNGMDMAIFPFADEVVSGALVSAPFLSPSATGSIVYINVEGIFDEALARATANGAEVVLPKMNIGPNGTIAHIMDSEAELESLILGARMVQAWSDKQLAGNATSALQRIQAIVPEQLKSTFDTTNLMVPDLRSVPGAATRLPEIRSAIKSKTKIHIEYKREDATPSTRILWPLGLFFWGQVWTLVAWCELRKGHRQFRIDRIESISKLEQMFSETPEQLLEAYLLSVVCEGGPVLR